jgi:hypothetical protein
MKIIEPETISKHESITEAMTEIEPERITIASLMPIRSTLNAKDNRTATWPRRAGCGKMIRKYLPCHRRIN